MDDASQLLTGLSLGKSNSRTLTPTTYGDFVQFSTVPAQRFELERAAFAYHCGNYDAAESIYDRLESESESPGLLVLLERAEVFDYKMDPHARAELLERARRILEERQSHTSPDLPALDKHNLLLYHLVLLQLRYAEFFAFGRLKVLRRAAREMKTVLRKVLDFTQRLDALEISCLAQFHLAWYFVRLKSNWATPNDSSLYEEAMTPAAELHSLSQHLYQLGDQLGANLLLLHAIAVAYTDSEKRELAQKMFDNAIQLCRAQDDVRKFRGLLDILRVAKRCFNEDIAYVSLEDCVKQVSVTWNELRDSGFTKALGSDLGCNSNHLSDTKVVAEVDLVEELKQIAPRIAMDLFNLQMKLRGSLGVDEYLQLAREAHRYGRKHQERAHLHDAYLKALDASQPSLNDKNLKLVVQLAKLRFELEDEDPRIPGYWLFAFAAYCDHTKDTHFAEPTKEVLSKIEWFFEMFVNGPELDGQSLDDPLILHQMHGLAAEAASELGLVDKSRMHAGEQLKFSVQMPHLSGKRSDVLSAPAQLNKIYLLTEITNKGQEWWAKAEACLKLLRRWAGMEIERGLLTEEEWRRTFYAGTTRKASVLTDIELRCEILGELSTRPTQCKLSMQWDVWLQAMESWLLKEHSIPFVGAKRYVYKALIQARCHAGTQALMPSDGTELSELVQWPYDVVAATAKDYRKCLALLRGDLADEVQGLDLMAAEHGTISLTIRLVIQREAHESGLINDDVLREAQENSLKLFNSVYFDGMPIRLMLNCYRILHSTATLMSFRHRLYGSVSLENQVGHFEKMDAFVMENFHRQIRHVTMPWLKAVGFAKSATEVADFSHHFSSNAIAVSLEAFYQAFATVKQINPDWATKMKELSAFEALPDLKMKWCSLTGWVQRSKARFFMEVMTRHIYSTVQTSAGSAEMALDDAEHFDEPFSAEQNQEQVILPNEFARPNDKQTKKSFRPLHTFQGSTSIMPEGIQDLLREFGPGVVLVEWFACSWHSLPNVDIYLQVHRLGQWIEGYPIQGVKLKDVGKWCEESLKDAEPLRGDKALERLASMSPLVKPLEETTLRGETLILCPTDTVHAIPLHALVVDGSPLIERNPVGYCQSFSHLRHCLHAVRSKPGPLHAATVASPLASRYRNSTEARESVKFVETLANKVLPTKSALLGDTLTKSQLVDALSNTDLLYWHGHISFKPKKAMQSSLHLADVERASSLGLEAKLIAAELLDINIKSPALAVVMGCQSGAVDVGRANTLLGINTSLYVAGATSIVATLWKVHDDDAVSFARNFFSALQEMEMENRQIDSQIIKTKAAVSTGASRLLNLAKAMRKALLEVRAGKEDKPYHWAAFTLNGSWLCPPIEFQVPEGDDL